MFLSVMNASHVIREYFVLAEPALIAKSNIILDVKPWDDETDMKEMERLVRTVEMDGLLWGAGM